MLSNFRRIFSENSARIHSASFDIKSSPDPSRAAPSRPQPRIRDRPAAPLPRIRAAFPPRAFAFVLLLAFLRAQTFRASLASELLPKPARPEFGSFVRSADRRIGSTIKAVRRVRQTVSSSEPQAFVTTGRITDAMCARTPAAMADSSGLNMSEWLFGAFTTPSGSVPRNM